VVRVVYRTGLTSRPPLIEIRTLEDDRLLGITVNAEVVISAGTLHTPTILLRSGIGSREVLDGANISVVQELPGVAANLQDHSGPAFAGDYTKPENFSPMPSNMLKPAFAADAAASFNETPARGHIHWPCQVAAYTSPFHI
jgi:choline dehydrogenase